MWDTIQKLEYRAEAGILDAKQELEQRLSDKAELPLPGIHVILTGVDKLRKRSAELNALYKLWDKVVDRVWENPGQKGTLYRDGMVYIGSSSRIVHTPAFPEQIPELMQLIRNCISKLLQNIQIKSD